MIKLHKEIMELLKKRAKAEHEYINPYFLEEIVGLISEYYQVDDDAVDKYVLEMFSA